MATEIVLEVHCLGCGKVVLPNEVDWLLFRTSGLAVHRATRCHDRAYHRLYPKLDEAKKEVSVRVRNSSKITP